MPAFHHYEKKYDNFRTPQYKLTIGGKLLKPSDYAIVGIKAQTSASYESGSCEITAADVFDGKNSRYFEGIYNIFSPGNKMSVELGYGSTQCVFSGYINKISFSYNSSGVLLVANCLDARGILFKNYKRRQFENLTNIKAIVEEMLAPCKAYVEKISVGNINFDSDVQENLRLKMTQDNVDDYTYLKRIAALTGSRFCVIKNELIFKPYHISDAAEIITLKWGANIMEAAFDIDISDQVGNIKVYYRDASTGKYRGSESEGQNMPKGPGQMAKDMAGPVDLKEMEIMDPMVISNQQAAALSKSLYLSKAMQYVTANLSIIGIPDIYAGSSLVLEGFGEGLNGSYFVSNAVHSYGQNGYTANLICHKPRY